MFLLICHHITLNEIIKIAKELEAWIHGHTNEIEYPNNPGLKLSFMDAISYTTVRTNLAKIMDQVCNDHVPVIITRKWEAPVVMISLEDSGDGRNSVFTPLAC